MTILLFEGIVMTKPHSSTSLLYNSLSSPPKSRATCCCRLLKIWYLPCAFVNRRDLSRVFADSPRNFDNKIFCATASLTVSYLSAFSSISSELCIPACLFSQYMRRPYKTEVLKSIFFIALADAPIFPCFFGSTAQGYVIFPVSHAGFLLKF